MTQPAATHVFDVTTARFQDEVLQKSLEVPVLVDFWATWCGPCKTLGPILEKLAADYNGAFVLAKVDVDAEQQLAGYFGIRSVPTVVLIRDGQPVDGFPGALPEGQLRQFLAQHGIEPLAAQAPESVEDIVPVAVDPQIEVQTLREAIAAEPARDDLKLDLALALTRIGDTDEATRLLDGLPANLAVDDRAKRARATLGFAALLKDAPPRAELERRIAADERDLRARHLLGAHLMAAGESQAALDQFLEMLRLDKAFDDNLPRRALIDAFNSIDDADLVSRYRRRMSSLVF
ncbi:thioredoxin [Chiayiivirga flava]|uniref:Thioredoxin n=1 Tax=Chiayiivirga flava TaxID=659595 RepID=A0A7W8D7Q9_9GAMM|nr:thioredoxin [Chiayiivirga flava]MBB5209501.1 putative thioredoxin [Chiayiivirga flava]